jgi:capsular polysaccharide biosynthesis protein
MKIVGDISNRHVSCRLIPKNFKEEDQALFRHEMVREIPSIRIVECMNMLIDPYGRFFHRGWPVTITSFQRRKDSLKVFLRRLMMHWIKRFKKQNIKQIANVVWITNEWSHGYFHWITETFPVLIAMVNHRLIDGYQVVLPSDYLQHRFIKESLNIIGVTPLFMDVKTSIKSKNLRTISTSLQPGNYNSELILGLRNKLRINSKTFVRVFCSRRNADKRRVKNEAEIVSLLASFKFVTVMFELLSFEEQRSLASSAVWLIGQHGAGLTNMVFMEQESNVLELRKTGDTTNNCYFSLASALNLNYHYLQCDGENDSDHNSDIVVSAEQLKKFLTVYCQ